MPFDRTTSAFSLRTSTTARRAGTTASGESDALRTSARPMAPSLAAAVTSQAAPSGMVAAGESQRCNLLASGGGPAARDAWSCE